MDPFSDASGFSQSQDMTSQFGTESDTPLPLPLPTRTDFSHPNGGFIQLCFCHLSRERATNLRTIVRHLLDQYWWRQGQKPPSLTELDHFVDKTNMGTYQCLFCMASYPTRQGAYGCVKSHLNIN